MNTFLILFVNAWQKKNNYNDFHMLQFLGHYYKLHSTKSDNIWNIGGC